MLQNSIMRLANRKGWLATSIPGGVRLSRPGRQPGQMESVYVSANSRWVCFQWPFARIGSDGWYLPAPPRRAVLYRYLLNLNGHMFMARFALDEEGHLLLMAEVPADVATERLTTRALESLALYADRYLDSICNLARPGNPVLPVAELPTARRLPPEVRSVPDETIYVCLKSLEPEGWGLRKRPAGQTWHLGYKGRVRLFEVYLTLTACWAYFQVPVLVEPRPAALQAAGRTQAAFLSYLLRLNDALYMARFGLDDEGQVLLALELPTEVLDFALFRMAARTLAYCLDHHVQEVQIMASLDRDSHLADLMARLEAEESEL